MQDTAKKPSLTLRRRLRAGPEAVFAAWTDPARLALWWGPEGSVVHEVETDPRVDGLYRVAFSTPDGEHHEVSGRYLAVEPPRRLQFDWKWITSPEERRSLVTVTIEPHEGGATLTLTHENFFDVEARDGHAEGWSQLLDRLEAALT